jgi:dUTPase
VSELTAKDALVSLFNSDASPMEVADPERVAEVVVQWLIDSGFKILGDD